MANHPDDIRVFRILERGPAGDGVTSGEAASIESRLTALEAATPPSDIDDLDDVDTTTAAPSDGDLLQWDDGDGEWQPYTPQAITVTTAFQILIGDGINEITTGIKGDARFPFAGEITGYVILADQTGSISVSAWKDTYGNYPPLVGDLLFTATITSDVKNVDTVNETFAVGDILRFNVNSVTDITRVTLQLTIEREIGP